MARKSRRTPATNLPVVAVRNLPPEKVLTAAYARLSVENGGDETDDTLQTQIALLHQYIQEHPEMELVDTYEDNGFSGTDFNRPDFIRMMDDVRSGKVQCIVVKDLSRFGRNYIETGYYIETLLPHLNVRLIAITDNFDSSREQDRNSLAVPIKNMVNAMYAKDFSKKLCMAAAMHRQKETALPNGSPPYGYDFSEDKTKYVVSESTAPYARVAFQMALLGVKQAEIARRMNFIGAITPGEQLALQRGNALNKQIEWTGFTVGGLLKHPIYAGNVILGRQRTALYKAEPVHRTVPSEWTVRENAHTPLITKEDFEIIQSKIAVASRKISKGEKECEVYREQMQDDFGGRIYCAECGRRMNFIRYKHTYVKADKAAAGYFCPPLGGKAPCGGKTVYLDFMKLVVMEQISVFIQTVCERKALLQLIKKGRDDKNPLYSLHRKALAIGYKCAQVEEHKAKLYENYAEGLLEKEDYQMLREEDSRTIQELTKEYEAVDGKRKLLEKRIQLFLNMAERLESCRDSLAFDAQLVQDLVEQIIVSKDGHIEIRFACNDVFQEIIELTGR